MLVTSRERIVKELTKLQRAAIIDILEARLYYPLLGIHGRVREEKVGSICIGYFEGCDDELLLDLAEMPPSYWQAEAAEVTERLEASD